jgi:lysozyme
LQFLLKLSECIRGASAPQPIGENMQISIEGLSLIKKFEGMETEAYKCAAGVWTIGYGHIKDVKEGDVITKSEADELLVHEIEEYENYVNTAVTVPLSQCQFDAIVSWVFNLGNGNLRASTMLKVINSGDHAGVPAQIKRWNKAGGKVLEGLIRRREAEALLYEGKDWSNV